jgi:hypothetical protein
MKAPGSSLQITSVTAFLAAIAAVAAAASVISNLEVAGRGTRDAGATTDVWAHDGFAYVGTHESPCGGEPEAGVWVWNIRNRTRPQLETIIASPTGSRSEDVKVASLNAGTLLVHSNQACASGGPGGFEIYDVGNPRGPSSLASVSIDEINPVVDALLGGNSDVGVRNLFLFSQGSNDYVAVAAQSLFDGFRIFDISDPTDPVMVSAWGPEEILDPGVGDETGDFDRVLNASLWLSDGFGSERGRFVRDVTVSPDGSRAWVSAWDAGLVLLDISDPADPRVVSVALDPAASPDGEVNSRAAWPSEDGTTVVETEDDVSAWESLTPPTSLTLDSAVPGDPTIPATAISTLDGDFFEANQTGLTGTVTGTGVSVDGDGTYPAAELATAPGSPTFSTTGPLSGKLVWIGRGCPGDPVLNAGDLGVGDIAVVRRGACEFEAKANAAAALGASALIVADNAVATAWGGIRIWDYSDPANPVLASTFETFCSAATAPGIDCDRFGTYTARNVIVETTDAKVRAWVSWSSDGVLMLDITDPWAPELVGHYMDPSGPNNGLPNDFWGVYKVPAEPWIHASDRNGGLYILKEYGKGTDKSDG